MSTWNSLFNVPDLDNLHGSILLPFDSMFTNPIQDGLLNHITLIKGLANVKLHEKIENYFCFTKLVLNNLVI